MARLTLLLTVLTTIIALLGGFRLLMGTIREMQSVEMVYAPSTQPEGKSWQRAR